MNAFSNILGVMLERLKVKKTTLAGILFGDGSIIDPPMQCICTGVGFVTRQKGIQTKFWLVTFPSWTSCFKNGVRPTTNCSMLCH